MKNKYTLLVLTAGTLWGFMGFFRRTLDAMGATAMGVIAIRFFFAACFFGLTMLLFDRSSFRIANIKRDWWIFLCCGGVSFLLFGLCYFKAMDHMSLSTAAILLYTAPSFVMLMSALLFGEKMTARKLTALALAFLGCCFVSGIGSGDGHLTLTGLLLGLGSGLCYALYSIFSRFALNRGYSGSTINFYACLIAAFGAMFIDGGKCAVVLSSSGYNLFFGVLTGFVTCFLPYKFYNKGLEGLENGKASIIASIEPVVATVVGFALYKETPTLMSFMGIILVLSAIILLNKAEKNDLP